MPADHTNSEKTISKDQKAVVSANTSFTIDVYQTLRNLHKDENIFLSPASLSTAFGLVYAGARGETAQEIADIMHFNRVPIEAFHSAMGGLLSGLAVEAGARLSMNNALWVDKLTVLEEAYTSLIAEHYDAGEFRVDYRSVPDAARKQINSWVEAKTEDRIKDLLPAGTIDEDTRSILVNTIYLKADWKNRFDEWKTESLPFHRLDGNEIEVPLMQMEKHFKHWQNNQLQLLEMPYRGEMSMVVLLPKSKTGLPALENELSGNVLQGWLDHLETSRWVEIDLKFPKLKLETKYHMVGEGVLPEMGMRNVFSEAADFSGAVRAERQPDQEPLAIGEVIHQTFLEIDENGTEAAAATAIKHFRAMASAQLGPPPPPPIPFYADHPFLFLIKDEKTGMVLFMGRILEPESA